MKVLILYVSTNSGHQRAALAIEKALRQLNKEVEIANFNYLAYVSPLWEKIVTHLYFCLIKTCPRLWNRLYDHIGVSRRISPLTQRINQRQSKKIYRFLNWFKPDAIVCTQAFPCGVMADFKKDQASGIRLVAVATDYVAHIYWVHDEVDLYVVATEEAKEDLILKGVEAQKIKVLGIPIDPAFAIRNERSEVAASLGLSPVKKTVIVMGGGQGYGPLEDIVREILKLKLDLQLLIITGTNEILRKKLSEELDNLKEIKIFGYINNVSEIMEAGDIIITKPGGLTTAEALARNLPMILISPIPGQEEKNRDFFVKGRMALKGDNPGEAGEELKRFILEPELLSEYKRNIGRHGRPSSSLDIAREILCG